ncbi:MAG: ABC transporter substrate-binding protein [Deltaproteobacteria bacterium]|nr:ABC transporter substrate-binding protein [Deltaproteobacteria bacterium]MBI3064610.1 ABC transporter substrate-binding protein [Deltaproteobacteria bacterium]
MMLAKRLRLELVGALVVSLIVLAWSSGTRAAEMKPANIRLDFIIGGKHAPWFVALEKGFYAKRGLNVTIQASTGSADTVRTIGAGGADFGFADIGTMIVAKSRGAPVQTAAQFGYVPATVMWREDTDIKKLKDLEGKSYAISPGQAQWYLMPAYCRINKINYKAIKIQETAAPLQPAALVAKKADFIVMYRGSNDEVAELAAAKQGIKLKRIFMKDTGLDIYGTGLIVKDDDIKKRPEFVRAYVEATLEGLRYARDNQEESLKILLKHKPELEPVLTTLQLKNALTEVFLPLESVNVGLGYMKPEITEKTVKVVNEYFDVARKVSAKEVFTNQFIKR